MTSTADIMLSWMSIAFLITGMYLMFRRYRRWRDALAWDKMMLPVVKE